MSSIGVKGALKLHFWRAACYLGFLARVILF